eukprot:454486-Pyramimonas_sp.AAC.1
MDNNRIALTSSAVFAGEVDSTHVAVADRRRFDAAARSRAALQEQSRQFGVMRRPPCRRAGPLG